MVIMFFMLAHFSLTNKGFTYILSNLITQSSTGGSPIQVLTDVDSNESLSYREPLSSEQPSFVCMFPFSCQMSWMILILHKLAARII